MSATPVNAATGPPSNTGGSSSLDGDDLLSLLDSLRRDGFPIGVREYIDAQQVAIACSDKAGVDPLRLRNWLAPILCTNPDAQRQFYQRFADWWAQRQPEPEPSGPEPQPIDTELDDAIRKARPWKWVALAAVLMAAAVVVPLQWMESDVVTLPPDPVEPDTSQPIEPEPPAPVEPEPIRPQLLINGRVTDLEGREIVGATVVVEWAWAVDDGTVLDVYLGPDGTRLVTRSGDETVHLWDAADGRELARLTHDGRVFSTAFSLDGTRLITIPGDKTARLWDATTGKEVLLLGHEGIVRGAAFNSDETRILTWSDDDTVRLWDSATGEEVLPPLRHEGIVRGAAFNSDETRILTWSDDDTVRLWDSATGEEVLPPLRHEGIVRGAAFNSDETRILTWSSDGTARLWDATTGKEVLLLRHEGIVRGAAFNSDETRILTWSDDDTVRLWDSATGEEVLLLRHEDAVWGAVFNSDETRILTWSEDKTARIWDAADGRELARLTHNDELFSTALSPDGTRVVTASGDGTVRLWDVADGREIARLTHHDSVDYVMFSPDGKTIATIDDRNVKLLHWAGSNNTGNFDLASSLTGDTQLRVYHPDYQDAPAHDIPDGYGKLSVEAWLAPRPVQGLNIFIQNRDLTRVTLTLLPLLAVTAWLLWQRKRRQLILERRTVYNVDELAGVAIPEPDHTLYRDESFVRARIEARRHQASGEGDLDADATVDATVRQLGWFTPVYKTRLRLPAYLALIDRSGFRDQQASLVDEFLDRLEEGGVTVDRYYFDRDPRMCVTSFRGDTTRRALRELSGRYSDHRLLLFSDGGGLLDSVTGRSAAWTGLFTAWNERVLMTPVPTVHWSSRELELARTGCSVLPATPASLLVFVEQIDERDSVALPQSSHWRAPFPDIISAYPARWLQRDEPRPEDSDELLRQLRRYLGDDSYRWLCALAVYPELDWYLTLYLGLSLKRDNGMPVLDETALLDLVRLPWLRRGNMPDWLRLRLITELSDNDENTVRGFLRELLRARLKSSGGRFHLDIAHPSDNIQRRGWTRFFSDLLRTEPGDSPLQDRVFVNFLLGKRPQRLQVLAPRNWHRWVYERGLSALGLSDRAGLLLAAAVSVLLAVGTFPLIDFVRAMQAGGSESQITRSNWQPADVQSGEQAPQQGPEPKQQQEEAQQAPPESLDTSTYNKFLVVMYKTRSRTMLVASSESGQMLESKDSGDMSPLTRVFLDGLKNYSSAKIVFGMHRLYRYMQPRLKEIAPELMLEYSPIKHGGHEAGEFIFVPLESEPPFDPGLYYALIIGNNNYPNFPNLNSAINDAQMADKILREKYGFKTTLVLDADRYTILSALSKFREELTEEDSLLIYYAGHNEFDQVNQRGHWLPVDAEPNSTANWISTVDIADILNTLSARHVLVVDLFRTNYSQSKKSR